MRTNRAAITSDADRLAPYDFDLPEDRIAIHPAMRRDEARLLVFDRQTEEVVHATVAEMGRWLRAGDLLVLNSARVDPVRVLWSKPTGSKEELVLLKLVSSNGTCSTWEALVSGRNLRVGESYPLPGDLTFCLEARHEEGRATITLAAAEDKVRTWLSKVGLAPIPPYIRKERKRRNGKSEDAQDIARYQTEFADRSGAVAAPTAGLHFSNEVLRKLEASGVDIEFIHLAVGWGTFAPLKESHWTEGKLHSEWVDVSETTAARIHKQKKEGRRVIAVGTTVVRALEWWKQKGSPESGVQGWCDIFLRPPWRSEVVDGMVTNFHLPRSSLTVLVGSFIHAEKGSEILRRLYREAVDLEYRFFSYGDAMLIV